MFRQLTFILFITGISLLESTANPVSIYEYYPGITEVFREDSVHWYIEIQKEVLESADGNPLQLHIPSMGKTYDVQCSFNEEGLAVLTPSSLTGKSVDEEVILGDTDELFIPDEPEEYGMCSRNCGWCFQLRPVQPGNSLVKVGIKPTVQETSRRSIGSRGNYYTSHEVTVLDGHGNLNPDILLFKMDIYNAAANKVPDTAAEGGWYLPVLEHWSKSYLRNGVPDDAGKFCFSMQIGKDQNTYFFDTSCAHGAQCTAPALPLWQSRYIDSDTIACDTFVFPFMRYELTVIDQEGQPVSSLTPYRQDGTDCLASLKLTEDAKLCGKVYAAESSVTVSFRTSPEAQPGATWSCTYNDSIDLLKDTLVIIPVGIPGLNAANMYDHDVRFSALPVSRSRVAFIIASSRPYADAAVTLLGIDGKEIGSIPAGNSPSGTTTVMWKASGAASPALPPGTYIARLTIDGSPVTSHRFIIR